MNPQTISRRLTQLLLAFVLLASSMHAPASAQRGRQLAQTTTRARPVAAAPRVEPQHASADTQAASAQRRIEPEREIEEMLSADSYGVYVEVRRLGALAQLEELKAGVAALQLLGDETKPLADLVGFVEENSETLSSSRAVLMAMPTRGGLPPSLLAIELPTSEAAIAFEPKLRRMVGQQAQAYKELVGGPQAAPQPRRAGRQAGREKPAAKPVASTFAFRRAGRWLLAADAPFTLKRLRGDETASALAEDVRFQSARTRFATDALFVYVDTTLAQQGWALQMQKEQEAREATTTKAQAEADKAQAEGATRGVADSIGTGGATVTEEMTDAEQPAPTTEASPAPEPSPAATPTDESAAAPPAVETEPRVEEEAAVKSEEVAEVRVPTEEQIAARQLSSVLSGLWGGIPRIPGAVALGVNLGGGSLAVRVAVENPSDGTINVIPFLPNIISGAPVTAEAAEVAPEDADLFFSTSLDWMQIYTSTLGTASLSPSYNVTGNLIGGGDQDESGGAASSDRPPTPDETIELVEKLFRFKFKEDLLPSLGNEVAISMPLDIFGRGLVGSRRAVEKKEEKDSEPGFVVLISLNNAEKIREILPRVLAAFSFSMPDAGGGASERREGFEIRADGGVAYAIINNFLVASTEVRAVRHVVDSFAARRTLATSSAYRDSTEWQAKQKILQAYVSEALMRVATDDTKKRSGASTDPLVRALLAQLDVPPVPASYEATNEGDVLVHELRVPVSMLKAYATAIMISAKDAPVTTGEAMAVYALNRIGYAQEEFKRDKQKERFGTLEELMTEGILEKDFMAELEYKIELTISGEKYEVTATPKNYGKTGRRSFFMDETGEVRGADHKGRPASVEDPPVN